MNDTLITSSLPFAAYLVASGALHLREVRLTDPRRAVFVFEDGEGRGPELEKTFLDGSAVVRALAFHHQLRILRRSIDEKIFAARLGTTDKEQITRKNTDVSYANQR